jgi:hypothetical protein
MEAVDLDAISKVMQATAPLTKHGIAVDRLMRAMIHAVVVTTEESETCPDEIAAALRRAADDLDYWKRQGKARDAAETSFMATQIACLSEAWRSR